ncbi:MAG: PASTA domain-containing protein [Geminicoccaceae bacterium]
MVRSLIVLAFCLMVTLPQMSLQAAALQVEMTQEQTLPQHDPAVGHHAGHEIDFAPPIKLAQSTGTGQRGPRTLGAATNAVQVPSLQCLSTADAETILRERGLRLGKVHQRPSNACPDGGIVAQSPPRSKTVRPGTAVEVVTAGTGGGSAPASTGGIPDLLGLTPAEAQSLLRSQGLDIGQLQRESAAAPLGTIIAQSPAAGSQASRGARINITVASEVRIPDLRTLSRADAIGKLRQSSLTLGKVTEESSSQPNGTIIKQWPLPGVPAAANDKVDITVAKGQTVPDLRTLSLNDARERLRDAGLRPGRVESRVSDQRRGTIIEQRPGPSDVVSPGVAVDVVLAATPIVPDLAGHTVDEAKRLIEGQLLEIGQIASKVSTEPQGTVIEQQPRANVEATPGSNVDLVLAEGLEVPKLVGLSLDEAGAVLAKQLMRLGKVERRTAADGDGKIIDQSPAPGAPGTFGVGIDVVISEPPTVPDLRGLTPDLVADKLAEKQLVLSTIDYQLSSDQADQTVLAQNPPAGSAIVNGDTVAIVLAVTAPPPDRPELVPVPEVTGLTAAQADQALQQAGLMLQLEGTAGDDRPNRVTAQAPNTGRLVATGSLVVASLESIDEVVVPDLLGTGQETIDDRLADAFLALGQQDWRLSTLPDGTVINQDPPAGTSVAFGNTVDVVFSASALVPDLTGLTPDEANPALSGKSLRLGGVREIFSLRWPGTIVDQTPEANSPARTDSIVEVQVVGMTGPLTAAGTLLLGLAGLVWFRSRQGTQGLAGAAAAPSPPPVYGIAKSATPRPAFDKTARSARPATSRSEPDYVVKTDLGTQVTQTDASNLVKPAIRVRGRADPGEQTLAIEKS